MKVAMLGHKAIPSTKGGIETVLTALCPLLAERGAEVTCYNRSADCMDAAFLPQVVGNVYKGVRLKKAPTVKKRGIAAMAASFTAAIACAFSRFDIVHFHAEGPCAAMFIPRLFGKKCVATVHGIDWQREKWGKGFSSKYIRFGEKMLVRHADAVIVLSEAARTYFRETYGRETVLIPNGIRRPKRLPAAQIKERYGLTKDGYFCLVSRLTAEKGVHTLIAAYKTLHTDKKLVICGETSDTDAYVAMLHEKAKGDDRILFTGFVSGELLGEIYSNAYAVCLPSTLEGMSLSLLEALAYGNAVICSDIPENTAVCGERALTFKAGDSAALAAKMQYLVDTPQAVDTLRDGVADYICSRFSEEAVADATMAVYERVLQKKTGDTV